MLTQQYCVRCNLVILMPNVLRDTIGWVPGNDGGEIRSWPSTRYMAVLPWLRRVANRQDANKPFIDRLRA